MAFLPLEWDQMILLTSESEETDGKQEEREWERECDSMCCNHSAASRLIVPIAVSLTVLPIKIFLKQLLTAGGPQFIIYGL